MNKQTFRNIIMNNFFNLKPNDAFVCSQFAFKWAKRSGFSNREKEKGKCVANKKILLKYAGFSLYTFFYFIKR